MFLYTLYKHIYAYICCIFIIHEVYKYIKSTLEIMIWMIYFEPMYIF